VKIFHIIFLSIFTILHGQSAWPFQVGERLTYNVSFTGITAGQASLEVVNDAEVDTINYISDLSPKPPSRLAQSTLLMIRLIHGWIQNICTLEN